MSKEMDILKHAIASKTSYTKTLQSMQTANTSEEQQQGLKGAPPNTSMTFPNTASSFTTKGMDYNINISKFDNNGSLVQSFANVPPGVDNLPMGNKTGNVIETPAHEGYQTTGYINKITTPIRKRLADNLYPVSYSGDPDEKSGILGSPIDKVVLALQGKKSKWDNRTGDSDVDSRSIQERTDFLQLLMGQDQKYNSVKKSKYKPTKGDEVSGDYYSSDFTENSIRHRLKSKGYDSFTSGAGNMIINSGGPLGNYTIDKGEDEDGKYISYYDKWDLNPFKEKSILNSLANHTQSAIGIKPPEVYGRVYENEKHQSKGFTKYQSIGHLPPRDNVMKYLHNSGRDTSYVNNVVKHIATQESKNTPTQRQIIDYKKDGTPIYGVGTGKFQYEQGKDGAANTAINRTVLFFKDKLDIDLTTTRHKGYENIYDLYRGDGTNTDFTKLSANEQDAIYLAEQIYSGEDTRDDFDILVKGRKTPPTSSEIFNYWGEFHKKKFDRSVKYKDEKGVDKTKTIKIKWDNLTTKEKKAEKTKWNDRTEDVHMPTDHDTDGNGVPDLIQRVPVKEKEKEENDYYNTDIFKMQSSGFNDEQIYNGGLLPEVEVSALTDESYSKLSKPQKQVYDSFKLPDGSISQTVQVGEKYNKDSNKNTRDMHYSDALTMVENEGVRSIKNDPSFLMRIFGKSDGTLKNRFRPHANPLTGTLYLSKFKKDQKQINRLKKVNERRKNNPGKKYPTQVIKRESSDKARFSFMKDVIAETAHIPEFRRKETFSMQRLGNVFSDLKGALSKNPEDADAKRYNTKGHFEHNTHTGPNSFEEKLRSEYEISQIGGFNNDAMDTDGMYYPPPNVPVLPVIEEKKEDIEQISKDNTLKNNSNTPHTFPTYTGDPSEDSQIHKRLEKDSTIIWDDKTKSIIRRPEFLIPLDPIEINILQPEASIQDNNYNRNLNLDNQLRVETQAEEDLEETKRIDEEEKIKEEAKNKRLAERAKEYETYKNKNLASTIDESIVFKNYSTKNKAQVTKLQEFLLSEGYTLGGYGADGKYGPATKKARDEYLADKKKEVESKVSITEYIDSTDNLSRVNFTEHLENNGLFSGGLSPNLELQSLEILGDDERAIMSQKSGFNITDILETELYRPTGSACSETGCAKGLNEHLRKVLGYEGTMGRTKFRQLFGVQEDAWNLGWKISDEDDGAGGETIFTVFDGSKPSSILNSNKTLNSKLKNLIYDSEAPSLDQFTTGDVLDLFYDGSGSYKDAVSGSKAGNWNTHTGVVSKGPDGNMYITHNVHGVFKSEPLQNVLDRQSNKGAKRKGHIMVASIHRPDWNESFDLSGTYKDSEGNTYDRETYTLKNIPGIDYKLKTRQDPKKGLRTLSSIASEENVRYVAGIQNNYLYTQTTFGLSDEDMQIITNTSLGVAFQESHYGTADDKAIEANDGEVPSKVYAYYEKGKNKLGGGSTDNFYAYKKNNPGEFGNDVSMGVTQIKLDNLSDDMIKELGMENSNNALILPETAAAATLLRTATTYKFLKAMQKAHPELNITSKNIPHILALGHNQNIFKDIESMLRGTDRKGKRINNTNFDWINAQNGTEYSNSVIMGSKYYDIDWKEFSMGANHKYDLYANNK